MIEVNLLPGGRKRQARKRSASFTMPTIKGLPKDNWLRAALVVGVLALGAAGWFWLTHQREREETRVALEAAVQDSVRYADLIDRVRRLEARRDSIVARVAVIQEIDQNRYVWPHVMDEVARALPEYTWLTGINQIASSPLTIQVRGRAGNNIALTVFMDQLENSPYLRGVRLITTEQSPVTAGDGGQQIVYAFEVQMTYEQPPLEQLQTVPLLGSEPADVGTGG